MKKVKRISIYLFLIVASLISLFPLLWMVVSMTNKSVDVTKGRLLPGTELFQNLQTLFETVDIATALVNSTIIAVVTTLGTLLIASLAGYGFEIYRLRSNDWVFDIFLCYVSIRIVS